MTTCHVLIPVGPGHEQLHRRAIESVRVAMEHNSGPFDDVRVRTANDADGQSGRSESRNILVESSDAEWVFFLDADDLMHPACFRNAWGAIRGRDAAWGQILEFREGVIMPRYQVPTISTYESLITYDAYLTLQMGHFVRREVALKYPFNTDMDTGEDWDYYLRIWRNEHCAKVEMPFMINVRGENSIGPRSATGADWRRVVDPMLEAARKELEEAA